MFLYDSELMCVITYKDKSTRQLQVFYSYLMNGFLSDLYERDLNKWKWVDVFFLDSNNKYGRLINTPRINKLVGKTLHRTDFNIAVKNNIIIKCTVHLKSEPENPRIYRIRKTTLLQKFISRLYDLFGDDWSYFEMDKYGIVENNSYRKKHPYLTPMGLQNRELRTIKKDKNSNKTEKVYLIYFQDKGFFKVGHTYQDYIKRILIYFAPRSDNEKKNYLDSNICLKRSCIIHTDNSLFNNFSLEKELLKEFSDIRIVNQKKTEFFKIQDYSKIEDYVRNISEKRGYLITKIDQLKLNQELSKLAKKIKYIKK